MLLSSHRVQIDARAKCPCPVSLISITKFQHRLNLSAKGASSFSRLIRAPVITRAVAEISKHKTSSRVEHYAKVTVGLGSLYAADAVVKEIFRQLSITLPSSLGAMFLVFFLMSLAGVERAAHVLNYFSPSLDWITKWLTLFYVPSLVTLPHGLVGISNSDLVKVFALLSAGMVATLLFTAQTAIWIRSLVQSPTETVPKPKASTPITSAHFLAWGSIATATLAATLWSTHSGGPASLAAQMALPFNLAATVLAYLIGSQVPKHLHGIFHPVLVTAVLAHVAVVFHGSLRGLSFDAAQVVYLNKGTHGMTPGAGDALMNVLGMVIVSFGLRIYTQRKIMKRHATEILGTTALSALFSMFSTALAAKALGLNGALARALVPRSVTVALAVPIARQLNASVAITAAAVLLQGLLGANFGPNLMTMIGVRDVIARGMAAAATAGGLGTAAIAAKEPEALPFCALSYSMIGIMSTCFAAVPPIMNALVAVLPP